METVRTNTDFNIFGLSKELCVLHTAQWLPADAVDISKLKNRHKTMWIILSVFHQTVAEEVISVGLM